MERSHSKSDGEVKQFLVITISHLVILAGDDATFHRLLIPSKWAGAIIGKGGVMINQLRDEVKYPSLESAIESFSKCVLVLNMSQVI